MAPPVKLAHFVLRTSDVKGLAAWYCNVLEAKIVHDADIIIFATYDEEHHTTNIAPLDFSITKGVVSIYLRKLRRAT